jgi:hypothetical protein
MGYIGNTNVVQNFTPQIDYFSGNGSTTSFTLSRNVGSVAQVQAVIENVPQNPGSAFTINGNVITFTSAPPSGTNNIYVYYTSPVTQAIAPSNGTVGWNSLDENTRQDLGISFKNKIINGNMAIDQRNSGGTVSGSSSGYSLDRWVYAQDTTNWTIQQSSVVPSGQGLNKSLLVTTTGTKTANTNTYAVISQPIEGLNIVDLDWGTPNAKTMTASFWVRSSKTGIFTLTVKNSSANRAYPAEYTINSANTWQKVVLTIPGPTDGTWLTTNGIGIYFDFWLMGSNFQGTPNQWSTSNVNMSSNQVNLFDTNGATFYLTGVQFEIGTQATAFTLAGGSYGAELALCQRYFVRLLNESTDMQCICTRDSAAQAWINLALPVPMRGNATLGIPSGFGRLIAYDTSFNLAFITISAMAIGSIAGPNQYQIIITGGSTSGSYVYMSYDTLGASTPLTLSAEL